MDMKHNSGFPFSFLLEDNEKKEEEEKNEIK